MGYTSALKGVRWTSTSKLSIYWYTSEVTYVTYNIGTTNFRFSVHLEKNVFTVRNVDLQYHSTDSKKLLKNMHPHYTSYLKLRRYQNTFKIIFPDI